MNNFDKYFEYIVFIIGAIIIISVSVSLSGCDYLKCYPKFDLNGQYIGIKCGGEW